MSLYGPGVRAAMEFEKAQVSLRQAYGRDADELAALPARITVWDWWTARDSVVECFNRGLAVQQAKEMCEYSVKSRLPVAWVLDRLEDLR